MEKHKSRKMKKIERIANKASDWWVEKLIDNYMKLREEDKRLSKEFSDCMNIENVLKFRTTLKSKIMEELCLEGKCDIFCNGITQGILKKSLTSCGMEKLNINSYLFPIGLMVIDMEEIRVLDSVGNKKYSYDCHQKPKKTKQKDEKVLVY